MTQWNFAATLPRTLVHRRAIAEVFLTGAARQDADSFEVAAQIPRYHAFYSDTGEAPVEHDLLLIVEMMRQAALAAAHEFFGVPLRRWFIWRGIDLRVVEHTVLAVRNTPTNVVLRGRVLRRFTGRTGLCGLLVRFGMLLDEREMITADLSYNWLTEPEWVALRASSRTALGLPAECGEPVRPPARIAAPAVGRHNPYNVTISSVFPGPDGAPIAEAVVDLTHPTLFDHPVDHQPAMLQLEVCRQFGNATAGVADRAVRGLSARFTGFGELDLPTTCTATRSADDAGLDLRCRLAQPGRQVADVTLRYCAPTGSTPVTVDRAGDPARV
jgi:hypothetical protein